jgi:Xaa-Pro dipeptidase
MKSPIGNIKRLRALLAESPFDAVVAVSPENVTYTCGVTIWTQRSIRDRLALVVWPRSGDPTVIVCSIEEPQTRDETFIADLRSYVEFEVSPIQLLADVLREKSLSEGHIGIELRYLSAHHWSELKRLVPGATLSECDDLFARTRMIKTEHERECLTQAARSTERALLATFATVHPGETETSMAQRLSGNILLSGAIKTEFLYINAGSNTGYPHCSASSYRCRPGDIVKADCGGVYGDSLISDVARTGVVGKPSEEQESIWSRIQEVHQGCIALVKPGNRACDVFLGMRKAMADVKLHFPLPHAGHSVGLTAHEIPILNPFDSTELQPNMIFYLESRVRWPGKVGYHVEDLVLVTEGFPQVLTGSFDNRELFQI